MKDKTYKVPFLGVGNRITKNDLKVLEKVALESNTYTQGKYQTDFERIFSDKFKVKYAIAVSNAVSGIELIADEIGIKEGDEVLCPAHTYCASAYPFLKRGAKIKWLDIDNKSWLSEEEQVINNISNKTKAVIFVHLYGTPASVFNLYEYLESKGIYTIEDCAQSLGAQIDDVLVGTLCDFSIFSFQSHKNISTLGEGGMIGTKHKISMERIKGQRHNGHMPYQVFKDKYWKPAMSDVKKIYPDKYPSNFCLNEFSCAIGINLLNKYESIVEERKKKWELARKLLFENESIDLQMIAGNKKSVFHLLPLFIKNKETKDIDQIIKIMSEEFSVQVAKQYIPLYRYQLFNSEAKGLGEEKLLKNTDIFYDSMISLPFHGSLTEEQITYEIKSLIKVIDNI